MLRKVVGGLLLLVASAVAAGTIEGVVVGVVDGDTVTVLDGEMVSRRVRLSGIDAPEKDQDFGARSKQSLSRIVYGKRVVVEFAKQDQYGRLLGKVLVGGIDANLEQVRVGMAWHYKRYEKEQAKIDRDAYSAAESAARNQQLGLWSQGEPTPPWEFRVSSK